MKLRNLYKLLFFFSLFLFFSSSFAIARRMTPQTSITGSVRVNICGDYIADGAEQCDRNDLRGLTCIDLGFKGGNLSCNFLCEIDFSGCSNEGGESPPSNDEGEGEDSTPSNNSSIDEVLERYIPRLERNREETSSTLPSALRFLQHFDRNNNGIIESSELPILVLNWVNGWKYSYTSDFMGEITCDLNNDEVCDLADFSILMFNLGE